jgi:hypothetical protein
MFYFDKLISDHKKNITCKDKKLIYISLPYVFFGSFIIYFFKSQINFKLTIALSILIVYFLNFFLKNKINFLVNNNKTIIISFIGFFHGLTNTGGPLISLMFQFLKKNKYELQKCIACAYFFTA